MKKTAILTCLICLLSSGAVFAATEDRQGWQPPQPPTAEMIKERKAREAAFEQKLGLTEAQKEKAHKLRVKGHKEMRPVMEKLKAKQQEAEAVKRSRIAIRDQEARLAVLDAEIQKLQKQANAIRKKNMKEFESILTADQKKILKQMKEEGRQKFEQRSKCTDKI